MSAAYFVPFGQVGANVPMGRLMSAAFGAPGIPELEAVLHRYDRGQGLRLLVFMLDEVTPVGIVGVGMEGSDAVIHHLSVSLKAGGEGIGQEMMRVLAAEMDVRRFDAVAYGPEVPFFEACGFEVTEAGQERGVQRFTCRWRQG